MNREPVDVHNISEITNPLIAERNAFRASYVSLLKQAKEDAVAGNAEAFQLHFMQAVAAKVNADEKDSLVNWYGSNRFEKETLAEFTARKEHLSFPLFGDTL